MPETGMKIKYIFIINHNITHLICSVAFMQECEGSPKMYTDGKRTLIGIQEVPCYYLNIVFPEV